MSFNLIQSVTSAQKYWPTTVQWVHDSLDQTSLKVDIDDRAKTILEQLKEHDSRTDKTRYQFGDPLTDREKLLKFIFNLSFRAQPDQITAAAETLHPEQAAFYPRWKKVCWIQIPNLTAGVLNNVFVKVILSVIVLYKSYHACYAAYAAVPALVGRATPLIINNTPLVIFRAVNAALDLKAWAYQHWFELLCFTFISKLTIGRLPQIPYVTPLALRILSIFPVLWKSPLTIASFVIEKAFGAAAFTWHNCTELANSIKGRASQANDERMATCKAKAFQVWQTIMIEQAPIH